MFFRTGWQFGVPSDTYPPKKYSSAPPHPPLPGMAILGDCGGDKDSKRTQQDRVKKRKANIVWYAAWQYFHFPLNRSFCKRPIVVLHIYSIFLYFHDIPNKPDENWYLASRNTYRNYCKQSFHVVCSVLAVFLLTIYRTVETRKNKTHLTWEVS